MRICGDAQLLSLFSSSGSHKVSAPFPSEFDWLKVFCGGKNMVFSRASPPSIVII